MQTQLWENWAHILPHGLPKYVYDGMGSRHARTDWGDLLASDLQTASTDASSSTVTRLIS